MTPQELKNSILQLAIQGKLVEQRPEEGTAEELFARIQEEKQRLIKEGKIKKEKGKYGEFKEEEILFDIPATWKWVRFGSIMINRYSERIPLSVAERSKLEKTFDYYGASGIIDKVDKYLFDKTLLLIGEDGANLLARSTPIAFLAKGKYWVNNHAHVLDSVEDTLSLEYIMYFVNAISLAKYVTGTAQPKMNQEKMNSIPVPLPPLAEQTRIVAKIEELLPYIDRYEQAWSKLEQFNSRFPEDMKKSLLQYAIQGKLVEQRPEEGTAEELFAQIQEEKQRLIKARKIKKEKSLPAITDDEKPFEIPESWMWVKLGSILHYIDTGKSFKCDEVQPTGNKCGIIKVSAVTWGKFNENESKTCYSSDSWVDEYAIHENDFLICRANTAALVGGCVIVDKISKRLMLSDKVLRLHFSKMIYPFYVLWALRTPLVRNQFSSVATGTSESMKNISQEILKNIIIPLPPLAEQKRIVEQLEQLLPLCERLK